MTDGKTPVDQVKGHGNSNSKQAHTPAEVQGF
jgi:hypothetical protein